MTFEQFITAMSGKTDGAVGLAAHGGDKLLEGHAFLVMEAAFQICFGEAHRHFARAGVTEAAGAQRDGALVCQRFNRAIIDQMIVRVVQIDPAGSIPRAFSRCGVCSSGWPTGRTSPS